MEAVELHKNGNTQPNGNGDHIRYNGVPLDLVKRPDCKTRLDLANQNGYQKKPLTAEEMKAKE